MSRFRTCSRSFINILFGCFLVALFSFFLDVKAAPEEKTQAETTSKKILFYDISDTIHGGTVETLNILFDKAKEEKFDYLLLQLDTPGGLLSSTEDIVKLFLNSKIPIIVYVAPHGARAGSAGTFITFASHVAAMAPGTYIGAAHPVALFGGGGKGEQQEIMKKKIESATTSFIKAIAKERGRNAKWAKKAVLESASLTSDEALRKNVIDVIAIDRDELLQKIDGRRIKIAGKQIRLATKGALIETFEADWKLRLLNKLASPNLMYLLMLGIIAGIYLEVTHPGSIVPGVIAGICLILMLIATRTLPVNFLGVLLILAALALLIAEIYVSSYGMLTVAAIACFFVGSLFLFDPVKTDVQVPLTSIIGASTALAIIAIVIAYSVIKGFKRPQTAGREHIIGMVGLVEEEIGPNVVGKVFLNGEYWNARGKVSCKKGQKVRAVGLKDLVLEVEEEENSSSPP